MHTAESNFSNFVIEYLGEIETESKILFCPVYQGPWNHGKNRGRTSRDTLPLKIFTIRIIILTKGIFENCLHLKITVILVSGVQSMIPHSLCKNMNINILVCMYSSQLRATANSSRCLIIYKRIPGMPEFQTFFWLVYRILRKKFNLKVETHIFLT